MGLVTISALIVAPFSNKPTKKYHLRGANGFPYLGNVGKPITCFPGSLGLGVEEQAEANGAIGNPVGHPQIGIEAFQYGYDVAITTHCLDRFHIWPPLLTAYSVMTLGTLCRPSKFPLKVPHLLNFTRIRPPAHSKNMAKKRLRVGVFELRMRRPVVSYLHDIYRVSERRAGRVARVPVSTLR